MNIKRHILEILLRAPYELASTWHLSPAPIKTFSPPWKSIGALEINGVLWLLAHTGEEVLMRNDGKGWKLISSHTPFHHPLKWVHKGARNFHQSYWLEDQSERRAPAFYHELGFTIKKEAALMPTHFQTALPLLTHSIPPVPAFYPELISPDLLPPTSTTADETNSLTLGMPNEAESIKPSAHEIPDTPGNPSHAVLQVLSLKENVELEGLISTVAHLGQENTNLNLVLQTILSKFDQKLSEEPDPLKVAMSNLENEIKSLAQVLRVMMTKQEQSDSTLENLRLQISQLQEETKELKNKGGFWSKWTL